ncbi:MAG: hypothetical protein IKU96_06065 [Alistipes sp.]|nr:hypothetical protein [Alistipes sp.]
MTHAEQEAFKAFVAEKCKEALAPLYVELEELKAEYKDLKYEPTAPQPDPEEVREAEFKKNLQEMKEMLIKSGRIKA